MRRSVDHTPESPTDSHACRGSSLRSQLVAVAIVVMIAALAAGCSSGSSSSTSTSASSSPTTTQAGLSKTAIRLLQTALTKVGCYSGSIDGIAGPATTQALRSFQSAVGVAVDGVYGTQTKGKLLAADSAGTKVCSASAPTTTTVATTTTTAASGSGVPSAATTAINSFETANGPAAGTWQISSSQTSTVDPSYVFFRIGPAAGHENEVQGGYGFAFEHGGAWSVIGFGTSEVGCPPSSSQNAIVPSAVLAEFGVGCPS
jgi:hypothetical protein